MANNCNSTESIYSRNGDKDQDEVMLHVKSKLKFVDCVLFFTDTAATFHLYSAGARKKYTGQIVSGVKLLVKYRRGETAIDRKHRTNVAQR